MPNIENTENLIFGKSTLNNDLDGSIDEVKIWNRALIDEEIGYLATKE